MGLGSEYLHCLDSEEYLAVISFRDFSASARLVRPMLRIRASTRQHFPF